MSLPRSTPTDSVDINEDKCKLVDVVEYLQTALTSLDANVRSRGTELLANALDRSAHKLADAQIPFFARFFGERLMSGDASDLPPSLLGITVLAQKCHLSPAEVAANAQSLLKNHSIQSYSQTARIAVFKFLQMTVNGYASDIRTLMGSKDFILEFVRAVDGEKDPRNLLISFKLAQAITMHFDYAPLAEDVFEISACYFPITFRPPPNDPYGITPADLKRELRLAMTSSPLFAPYAMPLIMEKMTSDNNNAKKDSFDTLSAGAKVYGRKVLIPEWREIWKQIKFCVENADEDVSQSALHLLSQIIKTISLETRSGEIEIVDNIASDAWANILSTVYSESLEKSQQLETKHSKLYSRLLATVAGSTKGAFPYIAVQWLTEILPTDAAVSSHNQCKAAVETLLDVLYCSKDLLYNTDDEYPLLPLKSKILDFLRETLKRDDIILSVKVSVARAIEALCHVNGSRFIDCEERIYILDDASDLLFDSAWSEDLGTLCSLIAATKASTEKLFTELSEELLLQDTDTIALDDYIKILKIVEMLSNHFDDRGSRMLLKSLTEQVTQTEGAEKLEVLANACDIIIKKYSQSPAIHSDAHDVSLTVIVDSCLDNIIQNMKRDGDRQLIMSKLIATCARLHSKHDSLLMTCMFELETILASENILSGSLFAVGTMFGNIKSKHFAPVWDKYQALENSLIECGLHANNSEVAQGVARLVAVFHNHNSVGFSDTFEFLRNVVDKDKSVRALEMMVWMIAGQVVRSSGQSQVEYLMNLLNSDSTIARATASNFNLLTKDHEPVLTKSSGATIRMLHIQKFFSYCLSSLAKSYRDAKFKDNYLAAFAGIISACPKSVMVDNMNLMIPMLYAGLSSSEDSVNLCTMTSLAAVIKENAQTVSADVLMLLKCFLKLSNRTNVKPMNVRIEALKCMSLITELPFETLYPHKAMVVRELQAQLDDHKRLVRKEAVVCRNKWFMVDSNLA